MTLRATPEEARNLEQIAQSGDDDAIAVGGRRVVPGASGLEPSATRNSIPALVLAVLLLLVASGLISAAPALRRRLSGRTGWWRGMPRSG